MSAKHPNLLTSIFKMKCPKCREGEMFTQNSIFPLKDLLTMPDRCEKCQQKMEIEVGFYYGTGYVSYALTVALIAATFIAYWILFGMSYNDNSVFIALGISVGLSILLQPWLMRLSRVIYLYFFVRYDKDAINNASQK